jgi:GT2 family glycosyltransferase
MTTTLENTHPKISCIYVNYRSAALLRESLHSLVLCEPEGLYEVIMVNNDISEKEDLQELQQEFPQVTVLISENKGFGAGANKGALEARGDLLFFVNPDTRWNDPFFSWAEKQFLEDAYLGALGIKVCLPSGEEEPASWGEALRLRTLVGSRQKRLDWVSGAAVFVSREAFFSVGGFDERFFLYFEDMDLCVRLGQSGYDIQRSSHHSLTHYSGKSHSSRKLQKKFYDDSLYAYVQKHWPSVPAALFCLVHPLYRYFSPYGRS